jgi:hypothetical protein
MILLKKQYQYLPLIIPALIVIGMFGFVKTEFFSTNQIILSKALTLDLLIGIPILYYLIIRKTKIHSKSILKVFTICLFIATLIIPENNIAFIEFIKQVIYPLLKIWIVICIVRKLVQIISEYKVQLKGKNGYELYSTTIRNSFKGKFGEIMLMEFSLLYFLFAAKRKSSSAEKEFGYSKNKGTVEMVFAFIFIIIVETIVAHILIAKWSLVAAVLSTYGSLYLIILFVSILRSRDHFPITVDDENLYLKSGYVNKSNVKFIDIDSIELSSKSNIPELMKLAAFKGVESHNIIIHFKNTQTILKVFGVQKEYKSIGIFVNEPIKFINVVKEKMRHAKEKVPAGNK